MTDTVALILGGSAEVFTEYVEALKLCAAAGMIEDFPDLLENGVTLHPEKLLGWLSRREAAGRARPAIMWAHRGFADVNQWTRDWSGSVGLFAVKIAREEQFRKIICCGIPMTIEAGHFKRKTKWVAAGGFQRGWNSHERELLPFVRSMSGWTKEKFGPPTIEWLLSEIPDPNPPRKLRRDSHGKA
jgi:hypothetical protein